MYNFSVDMLRLETRVCKQDFEYFHCKILDINPYVNYYVQRGFSEYRNNYQVNEFICENPFNASDSYNKFWFAYQHNSEPLSEHPLHKFKLVLEFNPNKCVISGVLLKLLCTFFYNLNNVYLKSLDVAYDIPIHIDNFVVDKGYKHYTCDIVKDDGRTIYLGSPGSDGRIKIYNKGIEQGVSYDWTRWEITLKFKNTLVSQILACCFNFNFNPPEVLYYDSLILDDFDVKMKCYIYSIKNGYVKLDDFSRKIKDKIKSQLLAATSVKKIDVKCKQNIYNTIVLYFIEFVKTYDNIFSEDIDKIENNYNKKNNYFKVLEGKQLAFKDI